MELHISRLVTDIDIDNQFMIFCSDGSNNVQSSMFDRSKPKIGCSSSFDVRKSDVQVSWKSNLVNLVKALLDSKFDLSKPKIGCSSSITSR